MSPAASEQGPTVQTVLGPVGPTELGITLIHEHLIVDLRCYWSPSDDPKIAFAPLTLENRGRVLAQPFAVRSNLLIDEPEIVADELRLYRNAGGTTIVDLTPDGIGRDPVALKWLAEVTGLNVISGCGYYVKASHPVGMETRSRDDLAAEMIRDLTVGIRGTGVRAGVIGEIGMATSPMDPIELKVLEAAVVAHQETGCAIVTHSAPGQDSPFEVVEAMEAAGADMTRVVQSHLDERFRTDTEKFRRLAQSGVNFGIDTFGRELYYEARKRQHPTDEVRVDAVIALLEAGLIDHVLLAQDVCFKHELSTYGGYGYSHLLQTVVPRLKYRGVSDHELDQMMRVNPARVLTGVRPD